MSELSEDMEDAWLAQLAIEAMAERYEPSLSLEEMAAELLTDQD